MTSSLPDPLSLWLQASTVPIDPVETDSVAAALIALWRHQERTLRCVAGALGHAQIAELAIELMLHPLRRQAELLQLAERPNPDQAVVLDTALRAWLAGQLSIAQLAVAEARQAVQRGATQSVWQLWVEAFERHQQRFLVSDKGRDCFARLCRAWGGLDLRDSVGPAATDRILSLPPRASADKKRKLVVLAAPGCPLLALAAIPGGLLDALADRLALSVYEWGGLHVAGSLAELEARCALLLQREAGDSAVLNLCPGLLQLPVAVGSVAVGDGLWLGGSRMSSAVGSTAVAELGLRCKVVAGELLAVLIEALYPDGAVAAWLAGESAMAQRRCCLNQLPAVSFALLQDMCFRSAAQSPSGHVAPASLDLLTLLADQELARQF